MPEADLQALVIEMLTFQPTTNSEYIALYISAKLGRESSIAEVNVALERCTHLGYVRVSRTWATRRYGTLDVVALALPPETSRPAVWPSEQASAGARA